MSLVSKTDPFSPDILSVVFMRSQQGPEKNRLIIERKRYMGPDEIIQVIRGDRASQLYAELLGEKGGDVDARAGLQGSIFSRVLQDL